MNEKYLCELIDNYASFRASTNAKSLSALTFSYYNTPCKAGNSLVIILLHFFRTFLHFLQKYKPKPVNPYYLNKSSFGKLRWKLRWKLRYFSSARQKDRKK